MRKYKSLKEANINFSTSDATGMSNAISVVIEQLLNRVKNLNMRYSFLNDAIEKGFSQSGMDEKEIKINMRKLAAYIYKFAGKEKEVEGETI